MKNISLLQIFILVLLIFFLFGDFSKIKRKLMPYYEKIKDFFY